MQNFITSISDKAQAIGFYIVLFGFPSLIAFGHLSEGTNNRLLDILLLSATFFWGSSKSGATKDATISTLAQANTAVDGKL